MNDEIKAKLLQYVNGLESVVESGGDFLSEQLPLFVKELLAWEFYSSIFLVVAFSILAAISCRLFCQCWRWLDKHESIKGYNDFMPLFGIGLVLSFIASCVFVILSLTNGYHSVKVAVAPRVVLMEKVVEVGNSIRK